MVGSIYLMGASPYLFFFKWVLEMGDFSFPSENFAGWGSDQAPSGHTGSARTPFLQRLHLPHGPSPRCSHAQKGAQQKRGGAFSGTRKKNNPGGVWLPASAFLVDSTKRILIKPSQAPPPEDTAWDNYRVFPGWEMKRNCTSRLLPVRSPSPQSTFPNTTPCQDRLNLLLTEYKLNCTNFSTVQEGGAGLWEWHHKGYGRLLFWKP